LQAMMAVVDQHPMQNKLRKTKFCSFLQQGRCLRGEACTYAHSQNELEHVPDFSKTTICAQWKNGKCPYPKEKCRFAHGKQDLRTQRKGEITGSPQLGSEPWKIQVSKPPGVFEAPALVPCTFRRPKVGDQVQSLVGEVTLEDADGREGAWKLPLGEVAIVSSVDEDGDFRLLTSVDMDGIESCVTYRKDYAYIRESIQQTWAGYSPWAGSHQRCGLVAMSLGWVDAPLTKPPLVEGFDEDTNSTDPGISSGNTSDDDCSTLGSDDAEICSTVAPPPGLCSARAVSPPPGLSPPAGFLPPPGLSPPPGLCHPSLLEL
jgi:hypothetical protein